MSYMFPGAVDAGPIAPIPYRGRSPQPYMQSPQLGSGMGVPASGGIQPGQMTYTTSIGPDGRPVYHLFRAESASYRSPQGLVSGIQWVPVDPVEEEPVNAAPASIDWIHQWAQNRKDPRDEKLWREWVKMEEKRRRREEKEYARQQKEYEKEMRLRDRPRSRAGSFSQPVYTEAPIMSSGGYLAAGGEPAPLTRQRQLSQSRGVADMDRYMRDMNLNDDGGGRRRRKSFSFADDSSSDYYAESRGTVPITDQRAGGYAPRGYARSNADDYPGYRNQLTADDGLGGAYPPGHILSYGGGGVGGGGRNQSGVPITDRPRSPFSGMPIPAAVPVTDRPRSPYHSANQVLDRPRSPYHGAVPISDRQRSPYRGTQALDRPRTPNYSYSGVSGPGYMDDAGSLAAQRYSPNSLINPLPSHMSVQQHQAMFPEAFGRMPSFQDVLTSFEPFLVAWLDNLATDMPRLPAVLVPHDVTHQDWIRFMSDVTSIWVGEYRNSYTYGGSRQPKRSTLTASLVDSWNSAYFLTRRVEVVLVKGKTRFSGPRAGRTESRLLRAIEDTLDGDFDDDDSDELSDLEDYEEYDSDRARGYSGGGYGYNAGFGFYGGGSKYRMPGDGSYMSESSAARRKWVQRIKDERRHQQRREKAKRERSLRNKYSLYLMSTA